MADDKQISAVIFDLDGTILDTERATKNVLKDFLVRYGKEADPEKEEKRIGKMFKESAAAIVEDYDLSMTPDEFGEAIMPLYFERWHEAKPLPGVDRLIRHLHSHGIPLALASNSIRKHIEMKISHQPGWKEMFSVILGGDEVARGKPAPDIFLDSANKLGVDPSKCVVIEDSPVGVRAAKAAGTNVVAVPSLRNQDHHYAIANRVLHSLLEFQPDSWGLPPFKDWLNDALPIEPLHIRGSISEAVAEDQCTVLSVIADESSLTCLPDQVAGVFFGSARIQLKVVFRVVVAIGWNLSSGNAERVIKPHLLGHSENFHSNDQLEMILVGYIRNLSSEVDMAEALRLSEKDKSTTEAALDLPMFQQATFDQETCHNEHL